MRPGLNLHDLEEIKLIFDAFDTNQTGLVNPKGRICSTQMSKLLLKRREKTPEPVLCTRQYAISQEKERDGSISKNLSSS